MLVIDEHEAGVWGDETFHDEPPEIAKDVAAEVALNSVIGLSNPKTMKLPGKIVGKEVVVMINPGATHIFISLVSFGNGEPV